MADARDLDHVLGLIVRQDDDGIAEIGETRPELLHALRASGLAVWRHDGWHPTQAGRDAHAAATSFRLVGVQAPDGIGLRMGAAIKHEQGRNRT